MAPLLESKLAGDPALPSQALRTIAALRAVTTALRLDLEGGMDALRRAKITEHERGVTLNISVDQEKTS